MDEQTGLFNEMLSHKEVVFRICLGFSRTLQDAEDLTQEVYLKAWRKQDTLNDLTVLKPWLYRVARNICLDHLNKMKLRRLFHLEPGTEPADAGNTPEQLFENRRQMDLLKAAVEKLSKKLRDVFVLKEYGRLSYREIADALGVREGTVMSRLNRARRSVMQQVRSENHDN